ncbi:MAG TPA: SUMF1/EgtB/PvdO family nonheme iron enzyme [Thermoanaerobaculia bacterium]|jgi:formylglycine-generating enzyme required for sulfatase activity|nr:SUMF1/EgtB/PvdO family nonheme iron enzyme [Thermoanaerobaculia bacterium]
MRHDQIDDPAAFYRSMRVRTRELFDLIAPEAYYARPIRLRNPIVFYEGHLPAFAVNTLAKLTLGRTGCDEHYETLFARGIDPADEASAKSPTDLWPSREEVQAYGREADALVESLLRELPVHEATFTVIEHELMHQETLLYMFHELPHAHKRPAGSSPPSRSVLSPRGPTSVIVPAGTAHLGQTAPCFGWDNEFPAHAVHVPEFTIDAHNVTNGDYLEFVEATNAAAPHFWTMQEGAWHWRGMFALTPLTLDAPVYVTHDEAAAYARWKGARLPTETELDRATYGAAAQLEGNYDFAHWDPVAVGSYAPNGFGLYDLIGNGWEWTSTLFAPFDGFHAMPSYPQYSADFFDAAHYVLKGASPATARQLVRRSLRNWFRPTYPYVYATFRCVR